jgi:hypothetical protein
MEIKIPPRSTIIPALVLLGTVTAGLSALFFSRLDQIVRDDLYIHGLQSDYNWAAQYWDYSRLVTTGLILATAVTSISFLVMRTRVFQARTRIARVAWFISCLLLLIGIVSAGVSVFFFSQVDDLVNKLMVELYRYGVESSYEWAAQCWIYARLFLGAIAIATTTSCISVFLLLDGGTMQERYFVSTRIDLNPNSTHLILLALLSGGTIALAFSIIYTSSVLVFIGLGLVFWGGLLYYIRPERYVKETLMNRMSLPSLVSLDQIMTGLGYKSKGIHLPPKNSSSFESTKVYFSAQDNTRLPTPEEIRKDENVIFLKNPDGLLITSPGFELTKLFEQTLGTNFTKVNLQYLEQNIPKLLIDLEIAQNVEMHSTDNSVSIRIEGSITNSICMEIRKLSNICGSLGCPLCSSIASAIAKATGKPIVIEKDLASEDGQIEITYRLLE